MMKLLHRLRTNTSGVAMIEFVLVFPILFVLVFGGLEINRMMLTAQKHMKSGYAIADIVTQYRPATLNNAAGEISATEITQNIFPQMSRIMAPYDMPERQAVIITSIRKTPDNTKTVVWQISGGGTLSGCDGNANERCVKSIVNGLEPGAISPAVANTPATFDDADEVSAAIDRYMPITGDANIIVVETFYHYQPLLQRLLRDVSGTFTPGFSRSRFWVNPKTLVQRTYFTPRNGSLFALPPTFPVQ